MTGKALIGHQVKDYRMAEAAKVTLPRDLLEAQLSMVELIRAMYPPSPGTPDTTADEMIEKVRSWCESSDPSGGSGNLPSSFSFDMTIPLNVEDSETLSPEIQIAIAVPLASADPDIIEPPPLAYSVRQPVWMSRANLAELVSGMPADDVLAVFDYIQEHAPKYLRNAAQSREESSQPLKDAGPLIRVWFYFPSLSTREKRKDLVSYAATYSLTGFVLAGKPGVLCLEGSSRDVDGYMNAIKNESWGDIPSHQKKVSERFREECGPEGRKFTGMSEITDDLGERRGTRKNRGDMAALEAWLKEKGVGDSFSKVVMGS
ncbi:hypothetical protein J7T55_010789 [Diaporthe amygdali]|uniref:uncharacterized protein n=1 Tax=Phomopsis amygdali TaxID=1214568 RepID=UPI0022FE116F|nr:uncharacterized protein J7T55_010789 [Diaporthe amygdali]KAJ0114400.1 hypothetical protein J7T55_010789 [Diaporthe amygdali]